MKVTVYGGAGKIGGNKILLEEEVGKVFLDFGLDFNAKNMFFSTFLQPRRFALISDYVLTGVVPPLKGLYRRDLAPENLNSEKPFVDAVLVSHGHLDHYGHVSLTRPDIPIYMGEGTRVLVKAREESKPRSAESLFVEDFERIVHVFKTGDYIRVGGMGIRPVHVDHSIPAAYGFIVEGDGGVLAYTGDIRVHGPRKDMTIDFVNECSKAGVDTLVIEGTRLLEEVNNSEEDVRVMMEKTVSEAEKHLVAVVVGMMDFDRLKTILQVSELTDRLPAISLHHAHVLNSLAGKGLRMDVPQMAEDSLVAYLERRRSGTYAKSDYPKWMANLMESVPTLKEDEIRQNPEKFILVLSRAEEVIELASMKPPIGSPFILSTSEPHSEEQVLEMDKINHWIELLGLKMYHIHASGHASGPDLLNIIREIAPEKVVPVHTTAPELFASLLQREKIEAEVVVPHSGKCFEVF
ncbi:MAG: MBL fold metallo-hydrolase [Candidatus Caldarchaeum sp.]